MSDIVERLREYASDDHERGCQGRYYDCSCGYDNKRDPLMTEAADEIGRLLNIIADARTENFKLRAALENVMIGGNSLSTIIGADHPPHGTPHSEALAHYGGGVKYEAWCCWNAIMEARAALEGKHE